jgi:hypothetical protein
MLDELERFLRSSIPGGFMKRPNLALILAAALLLAAIPARGGDTALELAEMLSGVFVGVTPNNNLRLDIQTMTTDPLHAYDLFLSVSGKFEDTSVSQKGLIRLESQGNGVYFGYVPRFDPMISATSPNAGRFTEREASAACGFSVRAKGDGFAGDTLGSQCAGAMRGATRKWSVEIEPGTILLRDPQSGETLRFKRIEKEKKGKGGEKDR